MILVDRFGGVLKGLGPVFCHISLANVAVPHGLEFREHSDEGVFPRGVLVKQLGLISLVVCLLVRVILLNCCVM